MIILENYWKRTHSTGDQIYYEENYEWSISSETTLLWSYSTKRLIFNAAGNPEGWLKTHSSVPSVCNIYWAPPPPTPSPSPDPANKPYPLVPCHCKITQPDLQIAQSMMAIYDLRLKSHLAELSSMFAPRPYWNPCMSLCLPFPTPPPPSPVPAPSTHSPPPSSPTNLAGRIDGDR